MVQRHILQRTFALSTRYATTTFPVRNIMQRRLASSEIPQLKGAADNAFNRERLAVKQHAAASSGTWWHEY